METNNPEQTGGLLDGVEPAQPFDMNAYIDETASSEKQQYERAHVDPEEAIRDEEAQYGPQEPGAKPAMSYKARLAMANFLIMQVDRGQAGLFTLFGAKGHSEDFRWNKNDRAEMAKYLEEGLPANFSLPWWAQLGIAVGIASGVNYSKLQEIKEQKRQEEAAAAQKKRQEAAAAQQDGEEQRKRDAFQQRREARGDRQPEPTKRPVAPGEDFDEREEEHRAQLLEDGICLECEKKKVAKKGNMYCSAPCRARANGRKGGKPKGRK